MLRNGVIVALSKDAGSLGKVHDSGRIALLEEVIDLKAPGVKQLLEHGLDHFNFHTRVLFLFRTFLGPPLRGLIDLNVRVLVLHCLKPSNKVLERVEQQTTDFLDQPITISSSQFLP